MHIAIGGIQTECSTYSRIRSRAEDFRILRGKELLEDNYFGFLRGAPQQLSPTFFARAVPGGPIERETYERFKTEFLDGLRAAGSLDGLYLVMHGAMYVEGLEDAEGDWIQAARKVVGERCLISASYDLHGNLSANIINTLDMLSAYRTAPHIDVEETMRKAYDLLVRCLERQIRPTVVWVPIPVLMPGERSSTVDEPAKTLYGLLPAMNAKPGVLDASLLVGYVWADEPRATASAVMTGTDFDVLMTEALTLGQAYWNAREKFQFGVKTGSIAECLDWTQAAKTQPVILADSGDNPTGGGVGDRAEILASLLARDFEDALVAGIADLPATEACYAAGEGAKLTVSIGATLDPLGSTPLQAEAEVVFLLHGVAARDRQAVVKSKGVSVVLTASRRPFHDIADFARLGLDPAGVKLLVVKSGYLSPELAPLANPNLMALSDGSINQNIEGLPPNVFRPPTFPFDRFFTWGPQPLVSARSSSAVNA